MRRIANTSQKSFYVVSYILDITKNNKMKTELEKYRQRFDDLMYKRKALSRRLIEAQEKERKIT